MRFCNSWRSSTPIGVLLADFSPWSTSGDFAPRAMVVSSFSFVLSRNLYGNVRWDEQFTDSSFSVITVSRVWALRFLSFPPIIHDRFHGWPRISSAYHRYTYVNLKGSRDLETPIDDAVLRTVKWWMLTHCSPVLRSALRCCARFFKRSYCSVSLACYFSPKKINRHVALLLHHG